MKLKKKAAANRYVYDMLKDGVTSSFIKKWRDCREQARLGYIEGWFNPSESLPLTYGTAAHWMLQKFYESGSLPWSKKGVLAQVTAYDKMYKKSRGDAPWTQAEHDIHEKTLGFLDAVMPVYMARCCMKDRLYNDSKRVWVSLEQTFVFNVEVAVNGGAVTIPVRGRIDGVFRDAKGKLWVLESKNLSVIDEEGIMTKLPVDLQCNVYQRAVQEKFPGEKVGGVLYNILRRPGLRQGVKETTKEFFQRVQKHVADPKNSGHYFMRYECATTSTERAKFMERQLKPILRSMYEWWKDLLENDGANHHYMNDEALLTKYGHSAFFHAITRGDFTGLIKRPVVFNELVD